MKSSRYDELYREHCGALPTKKGTHYERLAALTFKSLNESGVVVHNLKLRGESDVPHQIDVSVEFRGLKRRVLIECKDFDISGDPVGLSVVRDFWGVVDDIKPDEAIIITCNDFTSEALKFAKSKGIKLAILREFKEEDWEGRIKTIEIDISVFMPTDPGVRFMIDKKEYADKIKEDARIAGIDIADGVILRPYPIYLNTPEGRFQINDFIEKKMRENSGGGFNSGPVELKLPLSRCFLEVENMGGVPLENLVITYRVVELKEHFTVRGGVPLLILQGFPKDDLVISDDKLKRYAIDPDTGEVIFKGVRGIEL
jgi:hypothetical protein